MFSFLHNRFVQSVLGVGACMFLAAVYLPIGVMAAGTADDPFQLQSGAFADTVNLGRIDLVAMIGNGIQIFLGLLGIITLLIVLYAGWLWMTSNGDEEKITTAKQLLLNGVIGLAIILASYAITEFIIRKLTEATGFDGDSLPAECADLEYYNTHLSQCGHDVPPNICDTNPVLCLDDVFVVKSITPVTANTGMNNVVIRAIFSQRVATDAKDVMKIKKDGRDVTSNFVFSWIGSNTVLEVNTEQSNGLLDPGIYTIDISSGVRSTANETLQDAQSGVSYPLSAVFTIDVNGVRDEVKPIIEPLRIDGQNATSHIIHRGDTKTVTADIHDDHGVGFARMRLRRENASNFSDISYEGPLVKNGSNAPSSSPYQYIDALSFALNTAVPSQYTVNLAATDIDSNVAAEVETKVIVVGEQCDGTGGSIDLENPDASCLAEPGGSCSADWQCVSGVCDETVGRCVAYPIILDVSPWSGAPGNLVSVIGKYFGETPGRVYFGYDKDGSGAIADTEWVEASAPTLECPSKDLWSDNVAIVKVPDLLSIGASTTVKIVRGDASLYSDTTTDVRGPRAGGGNVSFPGYFVVTNESHPGLCSVTTLPPEPAMSAKPGTEVVASGIAFGVREGQLLFAGIAGSKVSNWSNNSAQARIPDSLLPGNIPVVLKDSSGKASNGVLFRIAKQDEDILPRIALIDPVTTTRQSFITISGARFGTSAGSVWISPNADDISLCGQGIGRPQSCVLLDIGDYSFCTDYWSSSQIFVYIPETLSLGKYYTLVQTNLGLQTDGKNSFEVVNGSPRPSICSLEPTRGPAPLPGNGYLTLRGINFFNPKIEMASSTTAVYFWKNGASSSTNPLGGTWLSSGSISSANTTISTRLSSSTAIVTQIPVVDGASMQSGPIVVFGSSIGGEGLSNAVTYTVNDCRTDKSITSMAGFQCCTEGAEAGMWKSEATACSGEVRDAGYVWRFTTGRLSNRPTVVEECSTSTLANIPSPIPSTLDVDGLALTGRNACINQMVIVRFGLKDGTTMVDGNVTSSPEYAGNVALFKCGDEENFSASSCDDTVSVRPTLEGAVLTIYDGGAPGNAFAKNTWYRVALSADIQGKSEIYELGQYSTKYAPLRASRPCTQNGKNYAYCFEFKTSELGEQCTLESADIAPRVQTTKILGRVSDTVGSAIIFHVFGRGNQACSVLNVDDLNWSWSSLDPLRVEAVPENAPKSKAQADAFQITGPNGSDIFASVMLRQTIGSSPDAGFPKGIRETKFHSGTIDTTACTVSVSTSVFSVSPSAARCPLGTETLPISVVDTNENQALQFVGGPRLPMSHLSRVVPSGQELFWSVFHPGSFALSVNMQVDSKFGPGESVTLYQNYYLAAGAPERDVSIAVEDGNRLHVHLGYKNGSGVQRNYSFYTENGLAVGTQYPIALVFNREAKTVTLYVNGVVWGSLTDIDDVPTTTPEGGTSLTLIGQPWGEFSETKSISLSQLGLFDVVLSAAEVRAMSASLLNVAPVGLRVITATSTVIVNPGKPTVIDYTPRCKEACVNVQLSARFSRDMVTSTYSSGYVISRCEDETCTRVVNVNVPTNIIALDSILSDSRTIKFNLQGTNVLATSTWYRVYLNDSIRAYIGTNTTTVEQPRGEGLEPFSWKFRTKADGTLCQLDSATVNPLSFVANVVSQKTLYSAQSISKPDECSVSGQVLNPWSYSWNWNSASSSVATVSNFKSGGNIYSWCTNACLPSGSTIARVTSPAGAIVQPICGNGSVDPGEDCDIAAFGETPGASCTFSCLRPGNNTPTCGNSVVETAFGEECDGGEFCSATCLNIGSSNVPTGSITGGVCGSGSVTAGEECDTANTATKVGCTAQCLHAGTPLSRAWCDTNGFSTSSLPSDAITACQSAVSVCGNNKIESGEQCEIIEGSGVTASNCSDTCLVKKPNVNVCGIQSLRQCESGAEGCSVNCTLLGASLAYNNPSVCGDVSTRTGKDISCETGGAVSDRLGMPLQVATAIGLGELVSTTTQYQQTQISAMAQSAVGNGEYYFQCGYGEYGEPRIVGATTRYNNCVDPTDGVGINSCCYPRPYRTSEYPMQGAGQGVGSEGVCRNTYIEATVKGNIDQNTLSGNVKVVSQHNTIVAGYCKSLGLEDVTAQIDTDVLVALAESRVPNLPTDASLVERLWHRVRTFIVQLFGMIANAQISADNFIYCSGTPVKGTVTYTGDGTFQNTTSTVGLYIGAPLLPQTLYFVVLDGGNDGITDTFGVGIKHPDRNILSDAWSFKTGDEICKLDHVVVKPSSQLFEAPSTSYDFTAHGETRDNQSIVSLPTVYTYEWLWGPGGNPLFDIPVSGSERITTSSVVSIASKNIEGSLYAAATAIVTADADATSESHVNKTFTGRTFLTSLFCDNVWPPRVGGSWSAFEDTTFHFRTFYCADAGVPGTEDDDLPVLEQRVFSGSIPGQISDDDVIKRYLLVSDKNDDVIGIQIVDNPNRLSVSSWYQQRFGNTPPQRVVVDGYEALTNGDTFYIGAYNEMTDSKRRLYNNIYAITINQGAQANTRAVLDQIIRNLKFNTNIADDQYCLNTAGTSITSRACTTDFDCRSLNGSALDGMSGVCGNNRTKLFNDLKRLQDIGAFQRAVVAFQGKHAGAVPTLSAGTYYPSYTNSMWPSWQGTLGGSDALSAALPRDPVNRWSQCGAEGINSQTCWNQASSTYACPVFSQIYEYKQTSTSTYQMYAQWEYLNKGNQIVAGSGSTSFIDTFINPALVSNIPWCVGEVRSPFGTQCGDGIVQPSEVCEVGQKKIILCGTPDVTGAPGNSAKQSQVCASDCRSFQNVGVCQRTQVCDNGIVEAGEACDDGAALNGTYGHCNDACSREFVAFCGNKTVDDGEYCDTVQEASSGPNDKTYCRFSDGVRVEGACEPYVRDRDSSTKRSCSYDCQSPGSYCGDKVVDLQFSEECDDGNTLPNDGCTNSCKKVAAAATDSTRPAGAHFCGDGVRDWEDSNGNDIREGGERWIESCDTGAANLGQRPNPDTIPYGEVRTYCSVDCQDILTVDAAARCGNGKRDVDASGNWIEACDIVPVVAGKSGVTTSTTGIAANACTDKGSITCTNSCQNYVDSCVSCNVDRAPTIGGYAFPQLALLNPLLRVGTDTSSGAWQKNVSPFLVRQFDNTFAAITENIESVDFMRPFGLGSTVSGLRLMAKQECRQEYAVYFGYKSGGIDYLTLSDPFDYPVNGEFGIIKNEYVTSPAVPQGVYRVVVRWSDVEKNKGVEFIGGVYSEAFPAPSSFNYLNLPSPVDWSMVCGRATKTNSIYPGFWWPDTSVCYGMPNNGANKVVYTHPSIGLEKTFVQSMTIDTTQMPTSGGKSIAVYVNAVRSSADTSVQEFKNSNLVVDVYTAHVGQDPTYSIYAPSATFSIKNAARSDNPDAPYWHVLNLVKQADNTYTIQSPSATQPNGVIVTDLEKIRRQTPADSCFGLLSCPR